MASVNKLLDKVEAFLNKNDIAYSVEGFKDDRVILIETDEGELTVSACEYDNSRVTFSSDFLSEDADGDSLKEIMTEIFTYFGFLTS